MFLQIKHIFYTIMGTVKQDKTLEELPKGLNSKNQVLRQYFTNHFIF